MASPWKFLARLVSPRREQRREDVDIRDGKPDILAIAGPTEAPAEETSADLPAGDEPARHDQSSLASVKLSPSEEAGTDFRDTPVSESVRVVKAAGPTQSDDTDVVIKAARLERTVEGASRKQRSRRKKAETFAVISHPSQVTHDAPADAISLDREIGVLRRQLASKLRLQNAQLKKMLRRFEG